MAVFLGLVLFGIIIYFLVTTLLFVVSVARHRQNNKYGRQMIYSCLAGLGMIAAIVWL